jgi:membrane protein implicated in regulation of membrane protease activity
MKQTERAEKPMPYQQIEIRQVGWRGTIAMIMATALGLGIVAALVVLSLGLAIILLPIIAIAALIGWFRWRKTIAAFREEAAQRSGGGRIIETEYEIIDDDDERWRRR